MRIAARAVRADFPRRRLHPEAARLARPGNAGRPEGRPLQVWAGPDLQAGRVIPETSSYNERVPGRECHHCREWIEEGEAHDCWTTTEAALTADLTDDLREAWERIRETAVGFGDQRIYASGTAIMFSRDACYFFVRPKPKYLELWFFLGRPIKAPQVRKVMKGSRAKYANMIRITHRDEVEAPITEWLREAYDKHDELLGKPSPKKASRPRRSPKRRRARAKTRT